MKFFAFRLFGPMASWGDTTLTRRRPTLAAPTKSAIAGLLGAAMGWERNKPEGFWNDFAHSFGMAVKVEHRGQQPLPDYHTVFAYKQDAPLPETRKEEVLKIKNGIKKGTDKSGKIVLSTRHYLLDFLSTVLIWRQGDILPSFDDIQKDMVRPRFPLYLGRKSCPLALPMEPQKIKADFLSDAFTKTHFTEFECLSTLLKKGKAFVYWDDGIPLGKPLDSVTKMSKTWNDMPVSKLSWTFSARNVNYAPWPKDQASP